jgi:uncharacterized membrane protein YhaH (DUF805 family)
MSVLQSLPQIIAAIGGLGTAAFGMVDASKCFWGGANRIGFRRITVIVIELTQGAPSTGLTRRKILDNLRSNWYNGTDLASQKSIAKSLIKQGLNPSNAHALARTAGLDPALLQSVATKISGGIVLAPVETDAYSRLDFTLTVLIDEAYQDADQRYTNGTRMLAMFFAILVAFVGGWCVQGGRFHDYLNSREQWIAVLVGLLATPLAPIAKDLSSALASAVNAMQLVRK